LSPATPGQPPIGTPAVTPVPQWRFRPGVQGDPRAPGGEVDTWISGRRVPFACQWQWHGGSIRGQYGHTDLPVYLGKDA